MGARRTEASGLCVGGVFVLAAAMPASAQYSQGFVWNRQSDWLPGISTGSGVNNPGPDAEGNPVWSYEVGHGGPLGSDDPWYESQTEQMTWDDAWWESGRGAWSNGDEKNPPVFADWMTHNLGVPNFDNVPIVRWNNPAGDGTVLDMAGTLRILWTGEDYVGAPTDVDVIVGMFDASAQAMNLLLATTVSKPHDMLSVGDWAAVPVSLDSIAMDAGDSIVISARGHDVLPSRWIDLHDTDVGITLVPAPGVAGLIAGIGIAAARRRTA